MSALRPILGPSPDPIEATTPVLATGHEYSTPSASSSDRMSSLVSCSSKASSGFWWILLLMLFNQLVNSGSRADFRSSWGEIEAWVKERRSIEINKQSLRGAEAIGRVRGTREAGRTTTPKKNKGWKKASFFFLSKHRPVLIQVGIEWKMRVQEISRFVSPTFCVSIICGVKSTP